MIPILSSSCDSPDLFIFRLKSPVLTGLYNNIIKLTFSQQVLSQQVLSQQVLLQQQQVPQLW